jgi:hypothetical protein
MAITTEMRTSVLELYTAYFNRAADTAGVDYWLNEMDVNGWTINNVAQSFAQQTEYTAIYDGLTNAQIVAQVYTNVLGRAAEAAGATYWEGELDNGVIAVNQFIQAVVAAATEVVDGVAKYPTDKAVVDNKSAVSQYAYDNNNASTTVSLSAVTDDTATVDTAKADVDAAVPVDPALIGETFVLTTGANDSFIGTPKNDSFTGTQATYQTGDLMIDATTTDNDILTLNTTSNITAVPTVSGIETITINAEKVGTFTFKADNISGANTITVNRTDLMDGAIDGKGAVTITGARATEFVAGDKVTDFTVDMNTTTNIATAAVVNATNATGKITVSEINYAGTTINGVDTQDVSVTEAIAGATGSKATVNIAGKSSVTNAVDELTLNATAATTITLDDIEAAATGSLTLSGDADITLKMAAANLTTKKIVNESTGVVNVELISVAGAAIDLSKVANVTSVKLATLGAADVITVADNQLLTSGAQTVGIALLADKVNTSASLSVLDNEATTAVTWNALQLGTVSTADNITGKFDTATIDATADKLIITALDAGGNDNVAAAVPESGSDIVLTGTQDIEIKSLVNAASLTSGSTGKITVVSKGNAELEQLIATGAGDDHITVNDADTVFAVNAGNGKNTIIVTDAETDSSFVTGSGNDIVELNSTTDTAILVTGAGDDKVTLTGTVAHNVNLGEGADTLIVVAATTATIAFGTGANILKAGHASTSDLSGATVTGNVDTIDLSIGDMTISSAQFNEFNGFALTGADTKVLTIDATTATTAQTIDASAITLAFGVTSTVEILGSDFGDTITGTIGADDIILGAAGETDTIIITTSDLGTSASSIDTITTFITAEDKLSLGTKGTVANSFEDGTSAADNASDVTGVGLAVADADGGIFDGTVMYAFYENATTANGYLLVDHDLDGVTDGVIILAGLDATTFDATTDIIA